MNRYNHPEIAIIALLLFLALARYSYDKEPGYTKAEVASMAELVTEVSAPRTNAEKMVYLYAQ